MEGVAQLTALLAKGNWVLRIAHKSAITVFGDWGGAIGVWGEGRRDRCFWDEGGSSAIAVWG